MIRVRSSAVNGSGSYVLGFGHFSPAKGSLVTNPSAVAWRIMARKLPARMFFTYLTDPGRIAPPAHLADRSASHRRARDCPGSAARSPRDAGGNRAPALCAQGVASAARASRRHMPPPSDRDHGASQRPATPQVGGPEIASTPPLGP